MSRYSEDGYFAIWDIRTKKPSGVVFARGGFNSVDFSPVDPNLLVSAHTKDGVKLWDLRTSLGGGRLRKPHSKSFNTYGNNNISGAYFNKFGNQIIASVKGGYPTLFSTLSEEPLCVMYSDSYRNMCTLKSCTFIGSDHEYIVSGSDDFRIYGWKIPADFDLTSTTYNSRHRVIRNELIESSVDNDISSEDNESEDVVEPSAKRRRVENKPETVKQLESHGAFVVSQPRFVLTGHKSIVNNIAYHPSLPLMVSSGVEKVIKMWSPYPITSEHREPMKVRRRQPYLFTNPSFANYFDMLPTLRDNENSIIESEQTLALFDFFNRCASVDGDEDDDDDDEIGANLMNIIGEGDSFEEDDEDASSSDQINESDLRRLIPQDINVMFMDDNEDYTDDIQDLEPSSDEMDDS
jgi:WD40 repeat protein